MPRRFHPIWYMCFGLWVLGLLIVAQWDLEISIRISDTQAGFGKFVQRFGELPAWAAVIGCIGILLLPRKTSPGIVYLRPLALAIVVLSLLHPLLITQALKFFWGRIRFRDLGPFYAGYTPFYLPAGIGTGLSFPSGHVAMAFVLSPAIFFFARVKSRLSACIVLALVLLYGLSVFWGRMLVGAHYLTDCLFSTGTSFLLAFPLMQTFLHQSRKNDCP